MSLLVVNLGFAVQDAGSERGPGQAVLPAALTCLGDRFYLCRLYSAQHCCNIREGSPRSVEALTQITGGGSASGGFAASLASVGRQRHWCLLRRQIPARWQMIFQPEQALSRRGATILRCCWPRQGWPHLEGLMLSHRPYWRPKSPETSHVAVRKMGDHSPPCTHTFPLETRYPY